MKKKLALVLGGEWQQHQQAGRRSSKGDNSSTSRWNAHRQQRGSSTSDVEAGAESDYCNADLPYSYDGQFKEVVEDKSGGNAYVYCGQPPTSYSEVITAVTEKRLNDELKNYVAPTYADDYTSISD